MFGQEIADGIGHWLRAYGRPLRFSRSFTHGDHLSPNHNEAMPRKEKKPTTSVTVVTKGPDDTAGSAPRRMRSKGIRIPPSAAEASTVTIARAMTSPRSGT